MLAPADSLRALAAELRDEESVLADHVRDPDPRDEPALGLLAAAGPRTADRPGDYALLFESVREGFLLHYGEPRLVDVPDADLALLAGDHLYALGLRRLAGLGDLEAVRELADLISLCAQIHGEPQRGGWRAGAQSQALWLATAVAVTSGGTAAHDAAKAALRAGVAGAAAELWSVARDRAAETRISERLRLTADAIDFRSDPSP